MIKKSKFICTLFVVLVIFSLTGFTPFPKSLNEKRASFSQLNSKYPYSHEIQNNHYHRAPLDTTVISLEDLQENFNELQSNPFFNIENNSVGILTSNGVQTINTLNAQKTFYLPAGISELENNSNNSLVGSIFKDVHKENLVTLYQDDYTDKPKYLIRTSNNQLVTGSLCMPHFPLEEIANPFFTKYKTLPVDYRTQSMPFSSRARLYKKVVDTEAKKYNLSSALILSIIHVESGFNPRAVSEQDAHGLMQIVASTAGSDVHKYFGNEGPLPPDILHNPATNIKYGVAYLHLLNSQHFKKVRNSLSREYCIIAAYNGGSGRVLNLFGRGEEAYNVINSLTPSQVYLKIRNKFPSLETRNYLGKVVSAKNTYSKM